MSQMSQHGPSSTPQRRDKFRSPPPAPASITTPPPSSSQQPYAVARTPTPTHSHLSSPPPTVKAPTTRPKARHSSESMATSSDGAVSNSVSELRKMLATAQEERREARTSVAHHRLQYELLSMESSEALKRKDVELEMARREVDVLQRSKGDIAGPISPLSLSDQAVFDLRTKAQLLEIENQRLHDRLADAKRWIVEIEATKTAETANLRKRIRDNRQHISQLRRSQPLFGELLPAARLAGDGHSPVTPKAHRDERISDLLLADQYLSQEATSAPSTPQGSRQRGHRAAQSLASLQSTPYRSTHRSNGPYYVKPSMQTPTRAPVASTRRRESRDSTISASDNDNEALDDAASVSTDDPAAYGEFEADPPSPAVVRAVRELGEEHRARVAAAQTGVRSDPSGASTMLSPNQAAARQAMMYGYQLKPGADGNSIKRRFYDEGPDGEAARPRKKGRSSMSLGGDEGVGLGIGVWK